MIRLPVAVLGGLTLCLATSAFAQTATTAAPQTVAMSTPDRDAKIEKLVSTACGAAPARSAAAGDKAIYAECRTVARSRAESLVP